LTISVQPTFNFVSDEENGYKRAIDLAVRRFGAHDLAVATALTDLANFYAGNERQDEAAKCDLRAGAILENWLDVSF
jgi:hypothetical protein